MPMRTADSGTVETRIALVVAVVLFVVGFALSVWALGQFNRGDLDKLGTFIGGTVGPIWSAATLLLLYAGYTAQRSQLEVQRQEISDASTEQQRSRLEARFYELLRLHNTQVDNLEITIETARGELLEQRGKRAMYSHYYGFLSEYEREFRRLQGMIGQDPQRLRAIFEQVERRRPGPTQGYYVSADSLLKALDRAATFDQMLADDLAAVLVSQFANYELFLLFIRFYSDASYADALKLARKYNFFRYFDERSIWSKLDEIGRRIPT